VQEYGCRYHLPLGVRQAADLLPQHEVVPCPLSILRVGFTSNLVQPCCRGEQFPSAFGDARGLSQDVAESIGKGVDPRRAREVDTVT